MRGPIFPMISRADLLFIIAVYLCGASRTLADSVLSGCDCNLLAQVPGPLEGKLAGQWQSFASVLAGEVQSADAREGWDVVFYGDSITEDFRGTNIGAPTARADGDSAVFRKYFSSHYSTGILAVAGDQIGNLQYRLEDGEIPKKQPKVAIVLIGTNDFFAVDICFGTEADLLGAVPGVNSRYSSLVQYMRSGMPLTHIILVGILPRAGWTLPNETGYPNRFSTPTGQANAHIQELASEDSMLHYIDCSSGFVNSTDILTSLMPDGLHPNAAGQELLAKCYAPLVAALVKTPANDSAAVLAAAAAPVSPCRGVSATTEAAGFPASAPTASASLPADACPPALGLAGAPAGNLGRGRNTTFRRAEAMAERSRATGQQTVLEFAPDPDCPLC
ncbi:hypothetical protein CVIRNUC_003956 [Coccomyxa viridis]|uniref:SGNH hydrolase-type esterase domain-containing protein n=1 Tax=Coccomyxa viridis TaxID=1274662 RepID=A0AAV1I050_9CHLO|nr:hypothetical protein CVIRNUC_003956 [Coccomyxa viridis]